MVLLLDVGGGPLKVGVPRRVAPRGTLDDLLSDAWEAVLSGVGTCCPVCAGELTPCLSVEAACGRCGECGSELS